MRATPDRSLQLECLATHTAARFHAMASPCELLIAGVSAQEAEAAAQLCAAEAWRVEDKFSRYRSDTIVHAINTSHGQPVEVDAETAELLDFAALCHSLSDGLFDVTSGVLRRVWRFDGSSRVPTPEQVADCQRLVGWHKVSWKRPWLCLPEGMEIDLGGIGKEYAVDRAFLAVHERFPAAALLVNFGGDLHAGKPPPGSDAWHVGIENAQGETPLRQLALRDGALATSGDAHRFLLHQGRRLSHILNPKTGWPVDDAPRSVTVAASNCVQAGLLSTLAMLQGAEAEAFLDQQQVRYWSQR